MSSNLVPRVSYLTAPSLAPGGSKTRDPGNEAVPPALKRKAGVFKFLRVEGRLGKAQRQA